MRIFLNIFMLTIALTSASCRHLRDFGQTMKDAALPASIVITDHSYKIVDDVAYSKEERISMTVKRGLFNSLKIFLDGSEVEMLDRSDSREIVRRNENNLPYFFLRDLNSDSKNMILTQVIDLYLGKIKEGGRKEIKLTETSVNPDYKGNSREKVEKTISAVYVVQKPLITEMAAPKYIQSGDDVTLKWSAKFVKRVELYHYGDLVQNNKLDTAIGDISDSFSIKISANDKGLYHPAFLLKAFNIYDEVEEKRLQIDFVSQDACPISDREVFQFCITCNAQSFTPLPTKEVKDPKPVEQPPYEYNHVINACSSSEARSLTEQQWDGCNIQEDACN